MSPDFSGSCPFCSIVAGDREADIVYRSPEVVAFLDARPVFKGHVLVVPHRHVATLPELRQQEVMAVMQAAQWVCAADKDGLGADGSFVAINNAVSQSVPHLHVHVIPRHKGDGLKGFFWPRVRYEDDAERAAYAKRLQVAIDELSAAGGHDE